jgi:uncharacterized protein YndB with AHSA1/START domain
MSNQPLVIERLLNAPVERVWEAITDKEQMKQWYFDIAEFELRIGFEFEFTGNGPEGECYVHRCKITEVVPKKKLQHSWRYEGFEGNSFVTWELFAEGDQTRVKLTHEGLETFPALPQFARTNFEGGWTYLVGTSIKNFTEQI